MIQNLLRVKRGPGWLWRWVSARYPQLAALRVGVARTVAAGSGTGSLAPENMIWIFGTGRSGSTWLRSIMGEIDGHAIWEEPMVGRLFGEFYTRSQSNNLRRADFIMGAPTRKGWIKSIRNFVMDCARYTHPFLGSRHYLVIKEPNGSIGAPLLMEALPESRMILLIRDPRDVAASGLDATREGSWLHSWADKGRWKKDALADRNPNVLVKMRSNKYLTQVGEAKRAYEAHQGRKVLVRYEELRADTLGTMRRLYSALGISIDEEELLRAVKKHSWESIPEEQKGEGKFYRKATPGGWREDLSDEQVRIVERTTAPLLEELYPDHTS